MQINYPQISIIINLNLFFFQEKTLLQYFKICLICPATTQVGKAESQEIIFIQKIKKLATL